MIDEERLRIDPPKMIRVVRSVAIPGAALLLVLGCGGRYRIDEELTAGAGRASVASDGGAPSLNAGGAGNAPPIAAGAASAGAPSAGAPSAGAPSGGAPSGGAPNACQGGSAPPKDRPIYPGPQDLTGQYQLATCGQATECTQVGNPAMVRTLDTVQLSVSQSVTDLSHGTVTLHGTGEILLDDRPFAADFTGRSFKIELRGPISTVCSQEYDLDFSYDFDGYGPRTLNLDFERSPKCSGNNGSEDCRGNVHSTFGDAMRGLVR
ncbi:MAG TPA: hypothetical protein VGL19_19755 [Polyangiaceae bacterium]